MTGLLGIRPGGGGPDVQNQAVLVQGRQFLADHLGETAALRADVAEFGRGAHALPSSRRHGRFPAQVADGRRGVGDAAEDLDARFVVDGVACDGTVIEVDRVGDRVPSGECESEQRREAPNSWQ